MRRKLGWFRVVAVVFTASAVLATTWSPTEVECPICHTKNSFDEIMSYGGYIYGWPSKFQMIYWPDTAGSVLYACKRCNYSAFMWDFRNPPANKIEDIRHALQNVNLGQHAKYTEIPMSQRLDAAEKVYSVLDKDDEFWCRFYRVKAYHLAIEKRPEEASQARAKALEIVHRMLNDPANSGKRKELLLVSGAMEHFLDNDVAAKADLETSLSAHYEQPRLNADQMKNANRYMTDLAKEYLDLLAKKKVPKDDGSDQGGTR